MVISWCLFANIAYSQDSSYHSIQEILDHHIKELYKNISHYDNIFVIMNMGNVTLQQGVFKVENGINAKFLRKRDRNYLVEAEIATQLNYIRIDGTNYRVIKISKRKVKLVNLSNGQIYIIK